MEKIFNYLNVGKNEPYYDLFESEILRYGFLKTTFNGLCLECAIYKTELAQILNSDIENFGFIYKRGKRELSKIFKIKDYQIRVIPKIKHSIFFKPLETVGFILKGNYGIVDIKKLNFREIYSNEFQKGIEYFNRLSSNIKFDSTKDFFQIVKIQQ